MKHWPKTILKLRNSTFNNCWTMAAHRCRSRLRGIACGTFRLSKRRSASRRCPPRVVPLLVAKHGTGQDRRALVQAMRSQGWHTGPCMVSEPGSEPLLRKTGCHLSTHPSSLPGSGRSHRPEPQPVAVGDGEVKRGGSASDPEPRAQDREVMAECVALRASHASVHVRGAWLLSPREIRPPRTAPREGRNSGVRRHAWAMHTQGGTDNVTEVVSRVARPWDGTWENDEAAHLRGVQGPANHSSRLRSKLMGLGW